MERDGDRITLRYERTLAHPVEEVWRALTDPAAAASWFGGRVEIDLRVGGEYVTHHQTGDRVVDRIVRLDPPHLLEHTFWVHLNPDALVTYELEPAAGGCRLLLTHRLTVQDLERAAAAYSWTGDPMDQLPRTRAGWHRLLDRLEAALGGDRNRPTA
ncbi:MAG TPA: SRPBCC domain-containing protein [Acidimicrobiales bacterium]|nr:SRPBCC domain-containing protein [Acidimicrobiales bacterium]